MAWTKCKHGSYTYIYIGEIKKRVKVSVSLVRYYKAVAKQLKTQPTWEVITDFDLALRYSAIAASKCKKCLPFVTRDFKQFINLTALEAQRIIDSTSVPLE